MLIKNCNRQPERKEEFPMSASPTSHSQSGFMSVESIGNALFYLIMLGVAALIVSVVMNTGKGGGDMSAISMVRSNVQYVGTSSGSYTGVSDLILSDIVPMLSIDADDNYVLPSGHAISTSVSASTSRFDIKIDNVDPTLDIDRDLCRKYAYYGVGSGFYKVVGRVLTGNTDIVITAADMIEKTENLCGANNAPDYITLTSN